MLTRIPHLPRLSLASRVQYRLLFAALATLTTAACSGDGPTAPRPLPALYFPASGTLAWSTARPSDAGFDSVALAAALDWAGTQASNGIVVLWRGRMVTERYWSGWDATTRGPLFSAGKTITSALVTQMIAEGRLTLDQSVSSILGAGWSRATADESSITVRQLLSMSSGLDDSLKTVVAPGTRFYYNNPAYYQLFAVLESVSGLAMPQLATNRLFRPIGMERALTLPNTDTGEPGYIFAASARDFARFGLLLQAGGRWNGMTVFTDSAALSQARRWSSTDNLSYGWLWWLNGGASHRTPGPYLLPTNAGPLIPSAPSDLVAAFGLNDKKLYLVPSLDLVVVRLGDAAPVSAGGSPEAGSGFDEEFWRRLMAARR
jgi:CubicO group peptidase (beta-lactamase class C family)